jgi:hypothetical protein
MTVRVQLVTKPSEFNPVGRHVTMVTIPDLALFDAGAPARLNLRLGHGKARVLITADIVRAAAQQPREQPRKPPTADLVNALREHVGTLKADVARLEGELAHARAHADRSAAELTALDAAAGRARGAAMVASTRRFIWMGSTQRWTV